jgi:hypothetical protein
MKLALFRHLWAGCAELETTLPMPIAHQTHRGRASFNP